MTFKFNSKLTAPTAQKRPYSETRHGITRKDDYAWLRADNWQDVFKDTSVLDKNIRAHLDAENEYAAEQMDDTSDLQQLLFKEMRGRIKEDDESVPSPHGNYCYGTSFVEGGQQPRFFRVDRHNTDAEREIILDGDIEAAGKDYFKLAGASHSNDHKHLIWSYDDKGSEYFTLRVRNLETQSDGTDVLDDTAGGGIFNADASGIYYARMDANHRPSQIYYHEMGTTQDDDVLVYEETDAGFFMGVGGTRLDDYIVVDIHDHETSEILLLPASGKPTKPMVVAERETGIEYSLEEGGDVWFILTNADGAKDFKIMTAPVDRPQKENWQELVPHTAGTLILSVTAYKNHVTWLERFEGLPRIAIMDRQSKEIHYISFDEASYSLGMSGSYEYDTETIRFSYSSMATPSQVYDYNMSSRERTLLKTQEVPSGHKAADYKVERLAVTAHDGESIPVSIVMRADTVLDGSNPCLLYGYGSYGISIPASFNTNCLSLVDRGFVYAIAHIRGGKDKGFSWYENGKRETKKNTFHDFVSVANYLSEHKFTQPDRLVAQGGSAGGMLMGAVVNMAPKTFGGIIAEVPFVDVLNTMLDETLPLTPPEWPEWGNPIESAGAYQYIASYSPYDNVRSQSYPPILAVSGLTDPRVTYWEPTKWIAKLREMNTSGNPALLKTNMGAGHGGASGRFSRLEEIAYSYAFAIKVAQSRA